MDMGNREKQIADYRRRIEEQRPVVQCITNIVTVNDCANALLAIGASPTMAHHPEEMADFAASSDALVCNMGATESLEAMEKAVVLAAEQGHPVVFDPVGCAGSAFRREKCLSLIRRAVQGRAFGWPAQEEFSKDRTGYGREGLSKEHTDTAQKNLLPVSHAALCCIRGNVAEIRALAMNCDTGRGVDDRPADTFEDSREMAAELAARTGAIVIASGAVDYLACAGRVLELRGGSPMMARITGSGCMLSSLLGAFLAVEYSLESAAACCAMMNGCGELAEKWTAEAKRGTGTYHAALLDALSL